MRFATAACMQKYGNVWKCKFRYSGVCKMYEVWGEGGGPIPWGGGGGGNTGHGTIYISPIFGESNNGNLWSF